MQPGQAYQISARDVADAKRLKTIIEKRGYNSLSGGDVMVEQKVPRVHMQMKFDGKKLLRSISKIVITGFVVLHGNNNAIRLIDRGLRNVVRFNAGNIFSFAGWDFSNPWPEMKYTPHARSPDASLSGFEHSIVIADMYEYCIGYVKIFGHFRFSVKLGPATGLAVKGLALNPRSSKPARFIVAADAPASYSAKGPDSFKNEHSQIMEGVQAAFNAALAQWNQEAREENAARWADELQRAIADAGLDLSARTSAIRTFSERLATIEHGGLWKTELDQSINEDEP